MVESRLYLSRLPEIKQNAYLKYRQAFMQCKGRHDRGGLAICMNLSFEQWWNLWEESGHWEERGAGIGKYCMRRHQDLGHFEIDNVSISIIVAKKIKATATVGFCQLLKCPHCPKSGNVATMMRWHFDKCVNL